MPIYETVFKATTFFNFTTGFHNQTIFPVYKLLSIIQNLFVLENYWEHKEEFLSNLYRQNRNLVTALSIFLAALHLALIAWDIRNLHSIPISPPGTRELLNAHIAVAIGYSLLTFPMLFLGEKKSLFWDRFLSGAITLFTIAWGVFISLIAQEIHGQVSAFIMTVFGTAALIPMRPRYSIAVIAAAFAVLNFLLPAFQSNPVVSASHFQVSLGVSLTAILASIFIFRQQFRLYAQGLTISNQFSEIRESREKIREQLKYVEDELNLASAIQHSLLPEQLPINTAFTVEVLYKPVAEIGGDYYDLLPPSPSSLALFIADVSGHGIPAALVVSMLKMSFSRYGRTLNKPDIFMRRINTEITGNNNNYFITAAALYLNAEEKIFLYTNAGHVPLIILDKETGEIEKLRPHGRLLGYDASTRYNTTQKTLSKQMRFFLFTDGILEQEDAAGTPFEKKFDFVLRATASMDTATAKAMIFQALSEHSMSTSFADDITLIIIEQKLDP